MLTQKNANIKVYTPYFHCINFKKELSKPKQWCLIIHTYKDKKVLRNIRLLIIFGDGEKRKAFVREHR